VAANSRETRLLEAGPQLLEVEPPDPRARVNHDIGDEAALAEGGAEAPEAVVADQYVVASLVERDPDRVHSVLRDLP